MTYRRLKEPEGRSHIIYKSNALIYMRYIVYILFSFARGIQCSQFLPSAKIAENLGGKNDIQQKKPFLYN